MLSEALKLEVFQPDEFIAGKDMVVVLGHEGGRVKATGPLSKVGTGLHTASMAKSVRYREYTNTAAWDTRYCAPLLSY